MRRARSHGMTLHGADGSYAALCAGMMLALVGCGGEEQAGNLHFETVRQAVEQFVTTGKAVVTPKAVYTNLNDGDKTNDPYVLSVRSAEHYARGHLPAAKNVGWRSVAKPERVANYPKDRDLVVYCYTGHTGGAAAAALGIMGYFTSNMMFGMSGWTKDNDVRAIAAFDETADANDFATETKANTPAADQELPQLDLGQVLDDAGLVQTAADRYLSDEKLPPTYKAADLYRVLNDGDKSNDPQIVSVRSAQDYAKGHIPGAINIPWQQIHQVDQLQKLDPKREIVVYCYTGHTGAVATTALNMMGYKARNLKFGIGAWTKDAAVRAKPAFSENHAEVGDFPLEK